MVRNSLRPDEILELLAGAPAEIAAQTRGLAPGETAAASRPGQWSLVQVLSHLRSCADVWGGAMTAIAGGERGHFVPSIPSPGWSEPTTAPCRSTSRSGPTQSSGQHSSPCSTDFRRRSGRGRLWSLARAAHSNARHSPTATGWPGTSVPTAARSRPRRPRCGAASRPRCRPPSASTSPGCRRRWTRLR